MPWYALYLEPKDEDDVASRIQRVRITILNLNLILSKFSANRIIENTQSLFPCYLFA
jgi:hypothetical protein